MDLFICLLCLCSALIKFQFFFTSRKPWLIPLVWTLVPGPWWLLSLCHCCAQANTGKCGWGYGRGREHHPREQVGRQGQLGTWAGGAPAWPPQKLPPPSSMPSGARVLAPCGLPPWLEEKAVRCSAWGWKTSATGQHPAGEGKGAVLRFAGIDPSSGRVPQRWSPLLKQGPVAVIPPETIWKLPLWAKWGSRILYWSEYCSRQRPFLRKRAREPTTSISALCVPCLLESVPLTREVSPGLLRLLDSEIKSATVTLG